MNKKDELPQCCSLCSRLVYDEADDCEYCDINPDEDEVLRLSAGECPYFHLAEEHQ